MGGQVHFKGNNTICNLLVSPRDKDTITQKCEVIYIFKCTWTGCEEEYSGESGRTFWDMLKEHFRTPSAIHVHSHSSGHSINVDSFFIEGREVHSITRTIKEAMLIRVSDPSLNRNLGKFQLPHIWGEVLQDISALHLSQYSAATP